MHTESRTVRPHGAARAFGTPRSEGQSHRGWRRGGLRASLKSLLVGVVAAAGLTVLAAAPSAASAQECARTYTTSELSRDLGSMTTALRSKDESGYLNTGQRLANQIACVRKDLPSRVFASAYRHIGAYYYLKGDFDQSKRWFKTAIELEPSYEWDIAELALDHPLRRAFDAQRSSATEPPVAIPGKALAPPSGATLKLDGRALTAAEATLDRPHLLLVVGDDRQARQVLVIDGNQIPEQFLTDADGDAAADAADPEDAYAAVKVERVRPPAKTPLMISGGALAIAGGAIYATSFATKAKFESASTRADLDKYRGLTNTLVVAAGATFAVGLGIEYVGIVISDQPGFALRGRF